MQTETCLNVLYIFIHNFDQSSLDTKVHYILILTVWVNNKIYPILQSGNDFLIIMCFEEHRVGFLPIHSNSQASEKKIWLILEVF